MDATQRAVATEGLRLHDGMGNPAGHKPGYVFVGNSEQRQRDAYDDARRAAQDARNEYIRTSTDAWRRTPPTNDAFEPDAAEELRRHHLREPDDNSQARRERAYRDYVSQLSNAWRNPSERTDPGAALTIEKRRQRYTYEASR
jgi:hypothetical protein